MVRIHVKDSMQGRDAHTITQQNCKTIYDKSEKMIGYDVSYRTGDHQGKFRIDKNAGTQIPFDDVLNKI